MAQITVAEAAKRYKMERWEFLKLGLQGRIALKTNAVGDRTVDDVEMNDFIRRGGLAAFRRQNEKTRAAYNERVVPLTNPALVNPHRYLVIDAEPDPVVPARKNRPLRSFLIGFGVVSLSILTGFGVVAGMAAAALFLLLGRKG